MIFGALGIDFVKSKGQAGTWRTREQGKKDWFSWQTGAIFIGIIIMVALPFTGEKPEKTEDIMPKLIELINQNRKLDSAYLASRQRDSLLSSKLKQIEHILIPTQGVPNRKAPD